MSAQFCLSSMDRNKSVVPYRLLRSTKGVKSPLGAA
jgi:hypothetical protein